MIDHYQYSRARVANTTKDVRLASRKRKIAYVLAGLLIAIAGFWVINYWGGLGTEQRRTMLIDVLFTAPLLSIICILAAGWFMEI